jgi:hypothetical protein
MFTPTLLILIPVQAQASGLPDVLVGIHMGYGYEADARNLIDRVSQYTNFIQMDLKEPYTPDGTPQNLTSTEIDDPIHDYAYSKGLYFVRFGGAPFFWDGRICTSDSEYVAYEEWRWQKQAEWVANAKARWGNHLIGFYGPDEPGGRQLDFDKNNLDSSAPNWIGDWVGTANSGHWVNTASDYSQARSIWQSKISMQVNLIAGCEHVTSDYGLYWFDYKAGFKVVLGEFVWDNSRQLPMAFCRGAANVLGRDWGVMITWKYHSQPYIESGEELYNDMVLAYDGGAKYIVIFDSDSTHTRSIMKAEHYQALERFWQYAQSHSRKAAPLSERVAFVLPNNYGYGFRWAGDKIWGWWPADNESIEYTAKIDYLLRQYGDKLDIIYDDGLQAGSTYGYNKLIYYYEDNAATPSPTEQTTPTANLTVTPTQTISPEATPTDSLTATAQPSQSSPMLQPLQSSSMEPKTNSIDHIPVTALTVTAIIVLIVAIALLVLRRRAK